MLNKLFLWLEKTSLNHAAIVLIGMYPVILLTHLVGTNISAALIWIFAYYGREVTSAQRSSRDIKALWPGNWRTKHDKLQTIYLVIVALVFAFIYGTI